jgi:hypothetical protein
VLEQWGKYFLCRVVASSPSTHVHKPWASARTFLNGRTHQNVNINILLTAMTNLRIAIKIIFHHCCLDRNNSTAKLINSCLCKLYRGHHLASKGVNGSHREPSWNELAIRYWVLQIRVSSNSLYQYWVKLFSDSFMVNSR